MHRINWICIRKQFDFPSPSFRLISAVIWSKVFRKFKWFDYVTGYLCDKEPIGSWCDKFNFFFFILFYVLNGNELFFQGKNPITK